jgi:cytochrome c-type biogenesis protein CcmH/NrfG
MSTGVIVAIVIAALIVLAFLAFAMPRMRARSHERKLGKARDRAAEGHRELADELIAEAERHKARADMHERGLADDKLEEAPEPGRFERDRESERTG